MTRRNGRAGRRPDLMRPSTRSEVEGVKAVGDRMMDLDGAYLRITGMSLTPPDSLMADLVRFDAMATRHARGDFRNTDSELKSLKAVAQWTLYVNAKLRNQPVPRVEL